MNSNLQGARAVPAQRQDTASSAPSLRELMRPALISAVFFMLLTGLAYPLVTTGIAQLIMPSQANGSLIEKQGNVVGSTQIGQDFTQARYFHPRPSATTGADPKNPAQTVAQPYNAESSGASNLAPTSKALVEQVASRAAAYRRENGLTATTPVPVDAVTASASGLDPDISVANALDQAGRVARARGLAVEPMRALVAQHTRGPQLGVLGDARVNVLELNLALDALASSTARETQ
jgi:potassium-transporting ATPase KdpC subunit